MISDACNAPEMQTHYNDKRRLAIAFLFTIGAKALVISEQKVNFSADVSIGANEEAEVKQKIVNEEKVRAVKRKLHEHGVVEVLKISRNRKVRNIRLKMRNDRQHDCYFSWRSKSNRKKMFLLNRVTTVIPLPSAQSDGTPLTPDRKLAFSQTSTPQSCGKSSLSTSFNDQLSISNNSTDAPSTLPFLRFQNANRVLDIQFFSVYEMEACLEIAQISPDAVWQAMQNSSQNQNQGKTPPAASSPQRR